MKTVATLALVAAATASLAEGHVYLTQPLAEFKAGASKSSWVAEFPPPWSGTFKTGAQYAAVAPGKGYKNLRAFLESKGPVCGNSLPNAKAKPIPSDGLIKLASTIEHPGPCEVWFDDKLAFHNDDCEKTFGSATQFKVDFSGCKGSCMLRFYWLGLQDGGKRWQSYKNCVPLGTGKSRSIEDEDETEGSTDDDESERGLDIEEVDAAAFVLEQEEEERLADEARIAEATDDERAFELVQTLEAEANSTTPEEYSFDDLN